MYWFVGLGSINENGEQLFKIEDDTDGVVEEFTASEIEWYVRHGNFIRYREGAIKPVKGSTRLGKRFKGTYFDIIGLPNSLGFLDEFGLIICFDSLSSGKNLRYIKDCFSHYFETNLSGQCMVIYAESSDKIHIQFLRTGEHKIVSYSTLKIGSVKDNSDYGTKETEIYNWGIRDGKTYGYGYDLWTSLVLRCYSPKNNLYKYYGGNGFSIDDSFKHEKDFEFWLEHLNNYKYINECEFELNVSLSGSKIYSPKTCCLLPKYINRALVRRYGTSELPRFCVKHSKGGIAVVLPLNGRQITLTSKMSDLSYDDDFYYNLMMKFFKSKNITPIYSRKVLVRAGRLWVTAKKMYYDYWLNELNDCLEKGWISKHQYNRLVKLADINIV